ncbi:MAG: hypothetical protein FGM24_03390 [Candidatus Kapabacteria bacterium]|nr:hypothetical protein [Candidatus Kapabacteria bacterium]
MNQTLRFAVACCAAASMALAGCEVFVIGGTARAPVVEISQRSAAGVVHLFKAELDSNNMAAATELIIHSSGRKLLAIEKYEMRDELARWRRLLVQKPITSFRIDTVETDVHDVDAVFDRIRHVSFSTRRVNDSWFITRIADAQ